MIGSMVSRPSSADLIGRDDERETLRASLAAAREGTTTSLLVAGEAGIGKSRLVAEAADLARADGWRVLIGGCVNAGEGGVPYGPLVDVLRQLVQDLPAAALDEVVGPDRLALARLLPSLDPATAPDPALTAQTDAASLLDAIVATVGRAARVTPTLLVVEDVHWADPGTRDALAHLVRRLRGESLVLIMTFRSDELHRRHPLLPWLADLQRSGRVTRLDLERLDVATTGSLVSALLGVEPPRGLVERIQQRSEGNPFFVEELVLAGGDGTARLPPTLRDVLLARMAVIPGDAQVVVDAAAVVGRPVEHGLLATLSGLDEDALGAAVRAAIDERLLVVAAAGDQDGYGFRHALLQEAAYDDLLPGDRLRWHRRVAEALAAQDAGQGAAEAGHWAELAHHWSAARDDEAAFEASIRAGTAASRAFAFVDARRHLERALGLWSTVADPEAVAGDRVEVLRLTAEAAWLGGDSHRPVDLNREAVAALGDDPEPVAHAMALERLGRSLWSDGQSVEALEVTRKALAILPEAPSPERARVLAGYGQLLMLVDRWVESIQVCEAAIAMARSVGARQAEGHALNTLGLDFAAAGRGEDSDRCLRDAIDIAREIGNADDLGRAYTTWSEAKYYLGDWDGAAAVVREGIVECDRVGVTRTYGAFARENGIAIFFDLGDWDEARRLTEETFGMVQAGHQQAKYLLAHWTPFGAATDDPLIDERLADLRSLLAGSAPEAQFDGRYGVAACERATWQGDPAAGLAVADAVLADLADAEWTWFRIRLHRAAARAAADLAELARARRDGATVSATLEAMAVRRAALAEIVAGERPRQHGQDREQTDAEVATVEAELGRAHGRSDPAAWADVAQRWAGRSNPYLSAYARWHEAEARLAAGDRGAASTALAEASVIADRLGARPLADAVRSLAARSRIDLAAATTEPAAVAAPVPASEADAFGLTPRERDVLPFLVQGRTNKQIAESLFISESTAGVHVSNILGKLGVSSRTEAAAIAVRLGLAD
jgi:DNA-binding NarL/FixJ family response regulator